jgi:hypothetical protein
MTLSPQTPDQASSLAAFAFGSQVSPGGTCLSADSVSLLRDGIRWMPVMGELHYTRVPAARWRDALLKLRAGGISCVASYVFWIHHEEAEGEPNWSGERDLRRFVATAAEVGLHVVVRLGPWCHGEVRNGGLPDWIVSRHGKSARTDCPAYLADVRRHYAAIAAQLDGLLWRDGGPVIAFQIENEYGGPAEHLLTLKKLAREVGLDAPYYTRTGWPDLATTMPFGELLPLYGAYPEGFWDRELVAMPGFYPANFRFSPLRTDNAIATDLLGRRDAADSPDTALYPFLTCELGGGMMSSYHRRIRIDPADISAIALVKLGSGGNLPGYYMYHGGVNPEGLTSLQESQATGYWNDLPEKNYDFQAPVGAAGQLRPHYHRLRRLHLFIHDYGHLLAGMPARFPDSRPTSRDDVTTLRWSLRTDGRTGFVFINNHERLATLPPKTVTTGDLGLPLPPATLTIPSGAACIWPAGLRFTPGVELTGATAELLCQIDEPHRSTVFFAATPGVPALFAFTDHAALKLSPGREVAHRLLADDGREWRIVLLSEPDGRALYKLPWLGRERVFLTSAGLTIDKDVVRVTSEDVSQLNLAVFPAPDAASSLFSPLPLSLPSPRARVALSHEFKRPPEPPRSPRFGWTTHAVALAPTDQEFAAAAVWSITLPATFDDAETPLLRIAYAGDVLRIRHGGALLLDDFFNGDVVDLDLTRHGLRPGARLEIEVLPLAPDAPIYLPEGTRPPHPVASLLSAHLIPVHTATLRPLSSP